jgi:hypothetical protein
MRICLTSSILAIVLTGTAGAQEPLQSSSSLVVVPASASGVFSAPYATLALAAQQTAKPTRPTARAARRRGSMVGYIDDARVDSKIRIRVDSASENTVPDRAEFFYAKCGCYQDLPATDPGHDPDAPGPRPGAVSDLDFNQVDIFGEWALGMFSVFGQLPMRWIQPQSFIPGTGGGFPNQSGVGDLRGGVRVALADSDDQSLTVQAQFYAPTGDSSLGLGTNHASFEPELLYYRRLADVAVIESQFGVLFPLGGSAGVPTSVEEKFSGQVLNFGVGGGVEVFRSSRVMLAPVVELVGWWVMGGFQTAPTAQAEGTKIVNVKIGGRVSIDDVHSIYVGYGQALTDATWYHDILRFEYRFSF